MYNRDEYIRRPVPINFELKLLFLFRKPFVIFDIGACEGEESVRYSRLFPAANIYTFEPLPANIPLIKANFSKYKMRNASLYELALSSKDGIDHFYISSGKPENIQASNWDFGNKSSSLLEPSKDLLEKTFLNFNDKTEVKTVTLKSFCSEQQLTGIDFIHMDVQGAELMVLEGAKDFISCVKVIWLEVSTIHFYKDQPLVEDIKEFMKKNDFLLLKDQLNSEQGDQLYVSKLHFSSFNIFFIQQLISLKSLAAHLRHIVRK